VRGPGARALGWLRNAVGLIFVAALIAGLFVPVYTDEVGWRFQERAAIDGVDKMFSDLCGPNSLARPPFFMMPARFYSAFFNLAFADPLFVRLSGILYALAFAAMVLMLIRRIADSSGERSALSIVAMGLLSLGTLPMLLVWSRPEQVLILVAVAALLIAFADFRSAKPAFMTRSARRTAWLRSIAILLLGTVAFSYHLKGIFLTPAMLGCVFFASRGREALMPRLVASALLVVAAVWSATYWMHRLQCPGDPILAAEYARNNMGAVLSGGSGAGQLLAAVGKLIGNIGVIEYLGLPTPREIPLSNWLERGQIGPLASFRWFLALVALWLVAMGAAAVGLAAGLWRALRERSFDPRIAMAVLLAGTVAVWSATQLIRNVYEAKFVLPVAMLAIVLALSGARGEGAAPSRATKGLAVLLGAAALASLVGVATIYAPSLWRAAGQQAYIAAQPNSVPVFGYAGVESDILATARLCGIPEPARAKAVMIDDLTYFTYMRSMLPQHRLGVTGLWRGAITDPIAYLKGRGSSGIIVGCHLLPPDLRARARTGDGKFCCLGPPNW
jgi:hypothetical protein